MYRAILKSISIRLSGISVRHGSCVVPVTVPELTSLTTLTNKLRVTTLYMDAPLACVTVAVAAGPRYETACTHGLTHLIEHLADKGSRSMSEDELRTALINMNGKMTVHTSREEQMFSLVVPTEHAIRAMGILFKVIGELHMNDSKIERERDNICRELVDTDADPKQVLFDYLNATAFQGTPLAQSVIGTSDNLSRFNADIASAFMSENYIPYRICLACAGKLEHNIMVHAAGQTFGTMQQVPAGIPEQGPNRFTGSQVVYRDDSMPFCHVAIAFEAPGYSSEDYYKMVVLKHIVGSWDRSQGRGRQQAPPVARWVALGKTCEHYEPFYVAYRDIGLWGVYFVADKWKLDEVVTVVQEQWNELCTVLTAKDVERGRNLANHHLAWEYTSVVSCAHSLARQMLYTCKREPLGALQARLARFEAKELRALANHMLYDRCPAVAAVGPSETLPEYARIRSGTWWLRV